MIKLIAFFGNIGAEYAQTRHNTGWLFADTISAINSASWQHKFRGQFAAVQAGSIIASSQMTNAANGEVNCTPLAEMPNEPQIDGSIRPDGLLTNHRIFVLKPETYMNLSGESVAEASSFYRIQTEEILVVHDELDLPIGTMSLKWAGGLGGHNGLRSMRASFGTADFWRLRFGIGRPVHGDVANYVLSPFTEDERISLSLAFDAGRECLASLLTAKDAQHLLPKWGKKKCVQ